MGEAIPPENPPPAPLPKTGDNEIPPRITDFLPWLVFHIKRDWIMFIKYPVAAFAVCAITLFLCWLLVWQVVVPEKDQQLQTRQDTIDNKQSLIDNLQDELQKEKEENGNLKNPSTNYYVMPQANTNSLVLMAELKPKFDLYLNGQFLTNGMMIELGTNLQLYFEIYNVGTEFATNLNIKLFAPFTSSNFNHDAHWITDVYSQPFPIEHKMYDYSKAFEMQMFAMNPVDWHDQHNAFDVTSFDLSTNYPLVSDPLEQMQEFGKMLNSHINEPIGFYMPIYIMVNSINSDTNEYCIFLTPNAP